MVEPMPFDVYCDYRYAHLVELMRRAGTPIAIEFDWHLPAHPGLDLDSTKLEPHIVERLERFGAWLEFRKVPIEQCITASLERFSSWIQRPKRQRYELLAVTK